MVSVPDPRLHRLAAFSLSPGGGNPAGVWIDDVLPDASRMQSIAAEVGYSETAFLAPATGHHRSIRYYSPQAEVSFCGHATIAGGVVLGQTEGPGDYLLESTVGEIAVRVSEVATGYRASLTSVGTRQRPVPPELLDGALSALRWPESSLDGSLPPSLAYAGAWHLVLAVDSLSRLERLDYDFDALRSLMLDAGLTTLQLVFRENADLFHSRNPFPVGGVVEDAATGAAAAALGGYLRDQGHVQAPASLLIRQGEAMGRPSLLTVDIPASGGITVSGDAVPMDD